MSNTTTYAINGLPLVAANYANLFFIKPPQNQAKLWHTPPNVIIFDNIDELNKWQAEHEAGTYTEASTFRYYGMLYFAVIENPTPTVRFEFIGDHHYFTITIHITPLTL